MVWTHGKNGLAPYGYRIVLRADISGGQVRHRPRLNLMDCVN